MRLEERSPEAVSIDLQQYPTKDRAIEELIIYDAAGRSSELPTNARLGEDRRAKVPGKMVLAELTSVKDDVRSGTGNRSLSGDVVRL